MHFLGYFLALVTGLSLGLMGSGGSILSVPILIYLFGIDPVRATAYSLFIVGVTSLIGLATRLRHGKVNYRAALWFAAPSLLAVFLVRKFLVHGMPSILELPFGASVTRDSLILWVFGIVMAAAGASMVIHTGSRPYLGTGAKRDEEPLPAAAAGSPMLAMEGILIGSITGFVGAGGGFLIVPAMVLFGHLPLETAIGTSLLIITLQSAVGFATDLTLMPGFHWSFLLGFSALSITGVIAGSLLAPHVRVDRLKSGFGWFTLIVAVSILAREILMGGSR